MTNELLSLKEAIYTTLINDTTLMNLVDGVYDIVSDNAAYPYITVTNARMRPTANIERNILRVELAFAIYVQEKSTKTLIDIMEQLYSVLHRSNINITNGTLLSLTYNDSTIFQLADGETVQGSTTYIAQIEEA